MFAQWLEEGPPTLSWRLPQNEAEASGKVWDFHSLKDTCKPATGWKGLWREQTEHWTLAPCSVQEAPGEFPFWPAWPWVVTSECGNSLNWLLFAGSLVILLSMQKLMALFFCLLEPSFSLSHYTGIKCYVGHCKWNFCFFSAGTWKGDSEEMAQHMRAHATKLDNLNSYSRIHMAERENQVHSLSSDPPHACLGTSPPPLPIKSCEHFFQIK